jgi:NADH-quinone oxidoreductase subunit M
VLISEWTTGGPDRSLGGSGDQSDSARPWSAKSYIALTLLVESFSLFVFLAGDVLLFYVFFEATLIPMYFLIGGFGPDREKARRAALKFLFFGLAGGLILLFAVIGTAALSANATPDGGLSLDIASLVSLDLGGSTLAKVTFAAFFVAFALKAPMVPAHTWLPDAAAQSTPGGAALMVGVLDKLGTFGMIRLCVGLFPAEASWATPLIVVLALISIFYGALAAIGSKNLMRLVAFTSISHFGFMVLGIFALTTPALTGAIFYMVNHGLATGALFILVGYLIKRRGSAQIGAFGGVAKLAPVAAGFTLLAGLAGCALPGTSSFVSEFLVIAGAWSRFPVVAGIATGGTILAALYILWAYQRLMTGPVPDDVGATVTDLTWRERVAVAPLLVVILGLGFFPRPALAIIEPTSAQLMVVAGQADPAPQIDVEGVR